MLQQILREEEEDGDASPRPSAGAADAPAPEEEATAARAQAAPAAAPRSPRPRSPRAAEAPRPAPQPPAPPPPSAAAPAAAAPPPGPRLWRGGRLADAEAAERALAEAAPEAAVSPLAMKRRARARPPDLRRTRPNGAGPDAPPPPASRRSAASGRGPCVLESMAAISRQLGKNAQYRAHGPGPPTALAVHAKFVAVGTGRGLTLVFDHFQEVRRVLGASSDDGVTSVDLGAHADLVACGHASGKIALWDVIKGTLLKRLDDAHAAPVAALRFARDDAADLVSVSTDGVVNRDVFSKAMFGAYGCDVECCVESHHWFWGIPEIFKNPYRRQIELVSHDSWTVRIRSPGSRRREREPQKIRSETLKLKVS